MLDYSKDTAIHYAIELCYLCRGRGVEIWNLTLNDIDDDKGVYIKRTKGNLPEWTIFTHRLRKVISGALNLRSKINLRLKNKHIPNNNFLFITRCGESYNKNARDSAWQRLYKRLVDDNKASISKEKRLSFHDIKAKCVSDHINNESGHKTESAKDVYMRKTKEVKATM